MIRSRLLAFVLSAFLSGCATTLNSDLIGQRCRRDAPRSLDTVPTLLDSGWLVLGIVPGLFAFGLDFATSAIWVCEAEPRRDSCS